MLKDFETFLTKNNVWHEFLEKSDMRTVESAAVHVPKEKIAKSIVFSVKDEFIVVIVSGPCKVSRKKLRLLLHEKNIQLAVPEDVLRVTGFEIGAVPPIGHKNQIKCILDKRIAAMDDVWAGGGSVNKLVHLKVKDIIKLNNPIVADVSE